jgi:lysophospholipase L1-like esterase
MPLGDSTTGSVCYRAQLWKLLNEAGYQGRFDFVGSRKNDPGCGVSGYDQDNEGHPSVLVTSFINDADDQVGGTQTPEALLGAHPADVVLFHFATNDMWNEGIALDKVLAAYTRVLAALRQANPNVVVLVAQLIPMAVTASTCTGCSCATCPTRIGQFNGMLAGDSGWAATHSTAASPVVVVDQFTGFNAPAGMDTADGVHPNASGSLKLATRWRQALIAYF